MRTVLQAAALICLAIAGAIGLGVIDLDGTTADSILLAVGWAGFGGGLAVASLLVGDWP